MGVVDLGQVHVVGSTSSRLASVQRLHVTLYHDGSRKTDVEGECSLLGLERMST